MPARAGVRSSQSFLVASPTRQGWQPVAGGRFGLSSVVLLTREEAAGETTTGYASQRCLHPGGMPELRVRRQNQPISKEDRRLAMGLAPLLGAGPGVRLPGGRPPSPWPTTGYRLPNPAGLVSESEIGTQPSRMDLKSLIQPWRLGDANRKRLKPET